MGAEELPENAAQTADKCDVFGGVLRPITAHTIKNTIGFGELTTDDIEPITKPIAPTIISKNYFCRPEDGGWLSITAWMWAIYIPDSTGLPINAGYTSFNLDISDNAADNHVGYQMNEQGMIITGTFPQFSFTVPPTAGPGYLKIIGPKYQFTLLNDDSYGGAVQSVSIPPYITEGDTEIPQTKVPLQVNTGFGNSMIYGAFEVRDVSGPTYTEEYRIEEPATDFFPKTGQSTAVFNIDLNYAETRRRTYYYVQSYTQDDGEVEGPPSDVSEELQLRPGQFANMFTAHGGRKLYRSNTGGDDFLLLDDFGVAHSGGINYQDWGRGVSNITTPPYGNHVGVTSGKGTGYGLLHPASFGVIWRGSTLYVSDRYRLHAYPAEYTVPFPESIRTAVLSGNTIIVFTSNRVYAVRGSNPSNLHKELLSDDKPATMISRICRIGQWIYWITDMGITATSGGDVKLITEKYFRGSSDFNAGTYLFTANNILYTEYYKIEVDEDVIHSVTTHGSSFTIGSDVVENVSGGLIGGIR